jgi:hypothetical protein
MIRGDCLPGGINQERPCPWRACRWHLTPRDADDVDESRPTCTLDVADRGGSVPFEEIAAVLGITRERVRQIETAALRKVRHPARSKRLQEFRPDGHGVTRKIEPEGGEINTEKFRAAFDKFLDDRGVPRMGLRSRGRGRISAAIVDPVVDPVDDDSVSLDETEALREAGLNAALGQI